MFADFDVNTMVQSMGVTLYIAGLIGLFMLVCMCFIFNKAGKPWWAAIIPVYNLIVYLNICTKPWWWLFLLLIPAANIVFMIILMVNFVKNFGKPGGHFWLLLFFSPIYIPYLAFSKKVQYMKKEEEEEAA